MKGIRTQSWIGLAGALLLASLASAGDVTAAETDTEKRTQARVHFERGKAAFEAGRYAEALREYEQAHKIMPLAGLLFNMGQCHRNLKHYRPAARVFRLYLNSAPSAPNRAAVERLIADLEAKEDVEGRDPAQQPATQPTKTAAQTEAQAGAVPATAEPASKEMPQSLPVAPPADLAATSDTIDRALGLSGPAQPASQPAQPASQPAQPTLVKKQAAPASAKASQPRAPVYKRWWFWTLVTAAAAGAITGIYYAVRDPGPDLAPSRFPAWELPTIDW